MGDNVIVYVSTVSANKEIKHQQQRIKSVLETKKINFEEVDVSESHDIVDRMRELCGQADALPPQVFKGDTYLGDFQAFDDANEDGNLKDFLKIES